MQRKTCVGSVILRTVWNAPQPPFALSVLKAQGNSFLFYLWKYLISFLKNLILMKFPEELKCLFSVIKVACFSFFKPGGQQMSEELWGGELLQWAWGLMWGLPPSLCYMCWYNPHKCNILTKTYICIYSDLFAWAPNTPDMGFRQWTDIICDLLNKH